jgi:hypothetical protein
MKWRGTVYAQKRLLLVLQESKRYIFIFFFDTIIAPADPPFCRDSFVAIFRHDGGTIS